MTAAALALALVVGAPGAAAKPACLAAQPGPGPGVADPFKAPAAEATELNAAGKNLYRQEKWEEARAQYRAAEAADPTFLAPRLNVACSFVRQERFGEAVAEVRELIARAYLPWAREVLEAADLGALKVQPQMAELRRLLGEAARAWGAGLEESVIFVGRERPPLRVPPQGAGEFILNPHQEVFAFLPSTGRFRQLTAEDGHVVAVAVAPDRRRVVYVTAEKLVRGDKSGLDGVAIKELTLATMVTAAPVPVPGPVGTIAVHATSRGFVFQIEGARTKGWFMLGIKGTLLPTAPARETPSTALTAAGTLPAKSVTIPGGCPVTVREVKSVSAPRAVVVSARGQAPRTIGAAYGAGLAGLPLP